MLKSKVACCFHENSLLFFLIVYKVRVFASINIKDNFHVIKNTVSKAAKWTTELYIIRTFFL